MKKIERSDVAVIVLTRNAGSLWQDWIQGVKAQTIQAGRYLVMDSASTDDTVAQAIAAGFDIYSLLPERFNHGGTRQLAAELCSESTILVYFTQDAILEDEHSLAKLLGYFEDPEVGLVYGRHIPHESASLIEQHARSFTYPDEIRTRTKQDFEQMGFRAAFSSDVYAAYRASALRSVGGFPNHIIVSEDSYVSARLLLSGWKSVYAANSEVKHSHHYHLGHIFRRYFDVGVFHATEASLLKTVGKPDKEAWVYVASLIDYLSQRQKLLLPWAAIQTLVKLMAFRLGKQYMKLPHKLCQRISLQKAYWNSPASSKALEAECWINAGHARKALGG